MKETYTVPAHEKIISNSSIIIDQYHYWLLVVKKKLKKKIINKIFKYLDPNNLLNHNQPGFLTYHSCVHKLLSVAEKIYKTFNSNLLLKFKGVFLFLSEVFDRVQLDDLIYKLKHLGISGKFQKLILNLNFRLQIMVLNVQS